MSTTTEIYETKPPSSGGPISRHCDVCGRFAKHRHRLDFVRCPRHWHWVVRFSCCDCGNNFEQPIGAHFSDCVMADPRDDD